MRQGVIDKIVRAMSSAFEGAPSWTPSNYLAVLFIPI